MRWTIRPEFLDRVQLRRTATRYARHGWHVTPGARLTGARFTCDRPGCPTVACHPALEQWEEAATCEISRVGDYWRHRPHGVLLATGHALDVVEVPAHLGLRMLGTARLRGHIPGAAWQPVRAPVAATPTGRWMFLVRPGHPLRPELEQHFEVVRHGPGSWVPAPPTKMPEGAVRWVVSPEQTDWRLPASYAVQALLLDAIAALAPIRLRTSTCLHVPRQMSTARRAAA